MSSYMTRGDGQRRYCAADSNKLAARLLAQTAERAASWGKACWACSSEARCRKVPFTPHQLKDMQIVCTPPCYIIIIPISVWVIFKAALSAGRILTRRTISFGLSRSGKASLTTSCHFHDQFYGPCKLFCLLNFFSTQKVRSSEVCVV